LFWNIIKLVGGKWNVIPFGICSNGLGILDLQLPEISFYSDNSTNMQLSASVSTIYSDTINRTTWITGMI